MVFVCGWAIKTLGLSWGCVCVDVAQGSHSSQTKWLYTDDCLLRDVVLLPKIPAVEF